jgi:lysophospholipase L1-like esterase
VTQPLHLVFFGDSMCVGQFVSLEKGWVTKVAAELGRLDLGPGAALVVTNSSVNGDTTRLALERMPLAVQRYDAEVVVVQFGFNDCNHWVSDRGQPRVSPRAFGANLVEIVDRAYAFGARRVVLHTNHATGRDREAMPNAQLTYEQSNQRYNDVIRSVARELGPRVVLNDLDAAFRERTGGRRARLLELLQPAPDLLHLSEAGHDLYAELTLPVIARAVREAADERRAVRA